MTKSSNKKIIRGATIEGTTYCSPIGSIEDHAEVEKQEKEHLKALEEFWYQKGLTEGERKAREKAYQEGWDKGYKKGKEKGKEEGEKTGLEKGLTEGETLGREKAEESIHKSLEFLEGLISGISREKELLLQRLQPEIVEFALTACKHVLQQEVRHPETLSNLFSHLIKQAHPIIKNQAVDIYLPKETFENNQELFSRLASKEPSNKAKILFSEDSSLPKGSLRIESPMGLVHFDMERILEELKTTALTDSPKES